MAHQQERPAGRQRSRGAAEHQLPLVGREVEKQDEHEVERALVGLEVEKIDGAKVDGDALARGARATLVDGHRREVDGDDVPPALREPDGVPALAAGEVERPPRREALRFAGEGSVRVSAQSCSFSAYL